MQASKSEIVKVRTMEPPDVSSAPNASRNRRELASVLIDALVRAKIPSV